MIDFKGKAVASLDSEVYVSTYQVMEIPDAYYPSFQVMAGGDVLSAVSQDFQHLMHSLANLSPSSASITIFFHYTPDHRDTDLQTRLQLYLEIRTDDHEVSTNLSLLIERGPLSRFYPLHKVEGFQIPWKKFSAATRILRCQDYVTPIHSAEFNDKIPPRYFTIQSFTPNNHNDFLDLDRVLGGLDVPVLIAVRILPVDIQTECMAHTRYLARLESINRDWGRDEDETNILGVFDSKIAPRSASIRTIRPLRRRDPLADDILRSQRRFHETLYQPQFEFDVLTVAPSQSVARLIGSLMAESAFKDGSYRLMAVDIDPGMLPVEFESTRQVENPPALYRGENQLYAPLAKLVHIAPVEELSGLFRLPVASVISPCCIRKNTDPPNTKESSLILLGYDRTPFSVTGKGVGRGPLQKVLCKSMFSSGVSGFGKTTSEINILIQLHANNIPFLVIEPTKTEYRIIKTFRSSKNADARRLAKALEVYTPGNETISPFRHNPLDLLSGITVDEHIGNLIDCFFAAMPATWPLPALIGEGLERVYNDMDPKKSPVIADLITATEQVLDSKGYSTETHSDIRAAMEVRLGVLARRTIGKIFQCSQSIPSIAHLMQVPTLIELDRLPPAQACLLILFIFLQIREYLRTVPQSNQNPRYVIVLEEAHRIAGAQHKAMPSPDVADPEGHATEIICQGLKELRGLGVGMIIIDQFPSAVAPEVIKSTTTKLAFRQVAQQDRDELGATMLFGPTEMEEIARMGVGEAFFITEGYYKPCKIQTINLHSQFDFNTPIANEKILPHLKGDRWYLKAMIERKSSELGRLNADMDIFDLQRMEINRQFIHLLAQDPHIHSNRKMMGINQLITKVRVLKERLESYWDDFLINSFRKYYSPSEAVSTNDPKVLALQNDLADRCKAVIQPDIQKVLATMDTFIERCQAKI